MANFISGWYLLYTKYKHEKKVEEELTEKNINVFLPIRTVLKQWHDRNKLVAEPLFPSYIFAYMNNIQNFYAGLNAHGSLYYVRIGNEPARVKEDVINSIKLSVSSAMEMDVCEEYLKPGRKMTISDGPLKGLSCEVVEYRGKQKLSVHVELLNRNILMSLPKEYISA